MSDKIHKIHKSDEQWRAQLLPGEFRVTRQKGTERARTGRYHDHHETGIYACVCCDAALFSSASKFDSGTGWPSFDRPIDYESVETHDDRSFGMRRVEVTCAHCEAHLGHVFEDGPLTTGLRYCLNSVALRFETD